MAGFPQLSALPRTDLRAPVVVLALLGHVVMLSCTNVDPVREWTPADHDQPPEEAVRTASQPVASAPNLAEVTWATNCQRCHGPRGEGDGPEGPMVRASDLTRADWQARVTDDDLATTIRHGRGKMPAFDLPPTLIAGLVRRIRAHRSVR
jgi:cytochrome c oxidase cbb3-type subunit 3